jgi:hypothetical protein
MAASNGFRSMPGAAEEAPIRHFPPISDLLLSPDPIRVDAASISGRMMVTRSAMFLRYFPTVGRRRRDNASSRGRCLLYITINLVLNLFLGRAQKCLTRPIHSLSFHLTVSNAGGEEPPRSSITVGWIG